MGYKKVQITFNLNNKMQSELYDKCLKEFGTNLSGGIKNVLSLYFNGGLNDNKVEIKQQMIPQQKKVDSDNIFASVL